MQFDAELLLLAMAPVFLACIGWEAWHVRRARPAARLHSWRDTPCNAALALMQQAADKLAWLAIIPVYAFFYEHYRIHTRQPGWVSFVALFIAQDLLYYVFHRCRHHVRWLIGKLGWLEYVFNTPSAHRVHHARHDRNCAGVPMIRDRLRGSYVDEDPREAPVYGMAGPFHTFNPLKATFHEWMSMAVHFWRMRGWRDKSRALFAPPAWAAANHAPRNELQTGSGVHSLTPTHALSGSGSGAEPGNTISPATGAQSGLNANHTAAFYPPRRP